jgi:hypothetical protein
MNQQELIKILNSGESTTIEYKEAKNAMPSSLFETVASFLNKDGGTILLGVSDGSSIMGIDPLSIDKIRKEIINASNNPELLNPPFTLSPESIEYENKTMEEKNRFLYNLVSTWLKSSNRLAGLKLSDIKCFENPVFFEVPSSHEKVPTFQEKVIMDFGISKWLNY